MKYTKRTLLFLATMLGMASAINADTITVEAPTGFFVPNDALKTSTPYYRFYGEDWSWQHGAVAAGFTTASLNISAYDVDNNVDPFDPNRPPEWDLISAKDDGVWVPLGYLAEGSNAWSFTNFVLTSNFFNDIEAGLEVRIQIDVNNAAYAVTLGKSVITTDGAGAGNPIPGVPDQGSTMLMLGSVVVGFASLRRFLR